MTFAEQIAASEDPVALVCAQSLLTNEEKQELQVFGKFIEKRNKLLKDKDNTEKQIPKLETTLSKIKRDSKALQKWMQNRKELFGKLKLAKRAAATVKATKLSNTSPLALKRAELLKKQEEWRKTEGKITRAKAKLEKLKDELNMIAEERKQENPYLNGECQIPSCILKSTPENYLFRMRKNQDNTRYVVALQNFLFETGDEHPFKGSYNVFFARLLDVSYPEYLLICEAMGADMQSPVGYTYPLFDKAEDGYHITYALTNRWNAIKDYFKPYEEEFPDEYDRTEDVDDDDTGESEE